MSIDCFTPLLGSYASVEPGEGFCPTGARVEFEETFTLQRVEDWVRYDQRAVDVRSGRVLHEESGVFRPGDGDALELALVMNSGRMELGIATWEGAVLHTHSESFFNDRLGVRANQRTFTFDDAGCDKELWLATSAWTELTRHMWGRLHLR